jgi:hypothetical protein
MSGNGDWVPSRDQDFVDLCLIWVEILSDPDKILLYNWNEAEVNRVLALIKAFLAARTAYEEDNSSAKRLIKDETMAAAKEAMRDFANTSIRFNKKMDDAAKLAMGVRPKDTTPTARPRAGQRRWWKTPVTTLSISSGP